jgi:hypothetical protein
MRAFFLILGILWLYPALALADTPEPNAHEVYQTLRESSLFGREIKIPIQGYTDRFATFGAEKEGSSSVIMRVMGPRKTELNRLLEDILTPENKAAFQRDFLQNWVSGTYRQINVIDKDGVLKDFDFSEFQNQNWAGMSAAEVDRKFAAWLNKAGDSSFSFVKSSVRRKFFNGDLPGLGAFKEERKNRIFRYVEFIPHLGDPQKFILAAHATAPGWEMNFIPQQTYGEQEKMVRWFRGVMGANGALFEAPGHQWNVFAKPKRALEDAVKLAEFDSGFGEMLRIVQAYIVLKGQSGRSGMGFAFNKEVHPDESFVRDPFTLGRGVVRTGQKTEFGDGNYGVELRAGTKSDETRRLIQESLTARVSTGDFSGLAPVESWKLHSAPLGDARSYTERFHVSKEAAESFIDSVSNVKKNVSASERSFSLSYLTPLWHWENAPFLSAEKKSQLNALTKSFVESIAKRGRIGPDELHILLQDWVKASRLEAELENYLQPRAPPVSTAELMRYESKIANAKVNVNDVDLGIEYTGRFHLKPRVQLTERPLDLGKRGWVSTLFDITPEERVNAMRQVAEELARNFGGGESAITKVDGGHGHGLGTAFLVKDQNARNWRVEWDGVTREYDIEGRVLPESVRGGHVELVTPKLALTGPDVDKVYATFQSQGMLPDSASGGGHINIDLEAFRGKPREFARFLSVFLENRGVMALMFQHVDRLKSAEPIQVSDRLVAQLKDFRGSEEDLQKLLYNERWFNQRVGRKSRYTQFDVSSYFQDVIPEKFISGDFDLFKDVWRQSFRVEPEIRKGEFRLFNAPRNARESALQTKFIRAMLDKALNDTSPLSGKMQPVDHAAYVKNPLRAEADFKAVMAQLNLNEKEYREYLLDGMANTRRRINSIFFEPLAKRLAQHSEVRNWGQAVEARTPEKAIGSSTRVWDGANPNPEALRFHELRQRTRARREQITKNRLAEPADRLRRILGPTTAVPEAVELLADDILPTYYYYSRNGSPAQKMQVKVILAKLRNKDDYALLIASAMEKASTQEFAEFLGAQAENLPEHHKILVTTMVRSPHAPLEAAAERLLKKLPEEVQISAARSFYEGSLHMEAYAEALKIGEFAEKQLQRLLPHPMPDDFSDHRLEILERVLRESQDSPNEAAHKSALSRLNKKRKDRTNPKLAEDARDIMIRLLDKNRPESSHQIAERLLLQPFSGNDPEASFRTAEQYASHQDRKVADIAMRQLRLILDNLLYEEKREPFELGVKLLKRLPQVDQALILTDVLSHIDNVKFQVDLIDTFNESNPLQILARGRVQEGKLKEAVSLMLDNLPTAKQEAARALERVLASLLEKAEGIKIVESVLARGWSRYKEDRFDRIFNLLKQHHRAPGSQLLNLLEWNLPMFFSHPEGSVYRSKATTITEFLMQSPQGARLVKKLATANAPIRAFTATENCRSYFERLGI